MSSAPLLLNVKEACWSSPVWRWHNLTHFQRHLLWLDLSPRPLLPPPHYPLQSHCQQILCSFETEAICWHLSALGHSPQPGDFSTWLSLSQVLSLCWYQHPLWWVVQQHLFLTFPQLSQPRFGAQWDDSVHGGACCHAWWPEFSLRTHTVEGKNFLLQAVLWCVLVSHPQISKCKNILPANLGWGDGSGIHQLKSLWINYT